MNRSTSQTFDLADVAELRKTLLRERQAFAKRYREEAQEARDLRRGLCLQDA